MTQHGGEVHAHARVVRLHGLCHGRHACGVDLTKGHDGVDERFAVLAGEMRHEERDCTCACGTQGDGSATTLVVVRFVDRGLDERGDLIRVVRRLGFRRARLLKQVLDESLVFAALGHGIEQKGLFDVTNDGVDLFIARVARDVRTQLGERLFRSARGVVIECRAKVLPSANTAVGATNEATSARSAAVARPRTTRRRDASMDSPPFGRRACPDVPPRQGPTAPPK